jgi:hypothetical protein
MVKAIQHWRWYLQLRIIHWDQQECGVKEDCHGRYCEILKWKSLWSSAILMKTVGVIYLSLLTIVAHGQIGLLNGRWVATLSQAIGDKTYSPLDGLILDIRNDSFTIAHVFSDSIKHYMASKRGAKLELNGRVFGKVHTISRDSLIIDFNETMRSTFIRSENYKPNLEALDLKANAWSLECSDPEYSIDRIDFLNEKLYPEAVPNLAIAHHKTTRRKYQEKEKWTLKTILGGSFLTLTWGQFDPMIYQVMETYGDSIKLIGLSLGKSKKFRLRKIPNKDEQDLDAIRTLLMKKIWETSEVQSPLFSDDTASLEDEYLAGHYASDTSLIERQDLIDRKISIQFGRDFTFRILVREQLFWESNWRLSRDGSYIIIGDGLHAHNYIEIISVDLNDLVIGKTDYIGIREQSKFIELYYRLRLR